MYQQVLTATFRILFKTQGLYLGSYPTILYYSLLVEIKYRHSDIREYENEIVIAYIS